MKEEDIILGLFYANDDSLVFDIIRGMEHFSDFFIPL